MSNLGAGLQLGPHYLTERRFDLKVRPLPAEVLVEEARIPMRDGVKLAASVYRPLSGARVPVIVTSTPYGKDNFDQWLYFRRAPEGNVPGDDFYLGTVQVSDHTAFEAMDPGYWVPRGYAVVLIDHPGMGKSESALPGQAPKLEERWHDAFEWLATQPWSSGSIGMGGVSALCATQWIAAKSPAHPALKAIIPWEGFNRTGLANGYGGIPERNFAAYFGGVWLVPNINPASNGPEPLLFEWAYDCAKIQVPALVCASTSDHEIHSWDTFDAFTKLDTPHKWLVSHRGQKWGKFYGEKELDLQHRFLERFLKGDTAAFDRKPGVVIDVHSDRWTHTTREAAAWPLPGTRHDRFYPDSASGDLTLAEPDRGSTRLVCGPPGTPGSRHGFTHRFDAATDLIGHGALHLTVLSEKTPTIDLFVGIEKLDSNGDVVPFFSSSGGGPNGPATRGWLRTNFRGLHTELSRPERPERDMADQGPLPDGTPVDLSIPLMPFAVHFKPGESLRLVVQTWSVKDGMETGFINDWDSVSEGACTILTGPDSKTCLILPVAT